MADRNREHRDPADRTGESRDATHIDIQKKQGRKKVWPWLLAALVALLVIWGLPDLRGRDEVTEEVQVQPPAEVTPPAPGATPPMGAAVQQFLTTAQGFATADAAQLQPMTADALGQLSGALGALAAGTPVEAAVGPQLDQLRTAADQIRQTPWTATTRADQVQGAFMMASQALEQIGSTRAGADATVAQRVRDVQSAAGAVDPARPVLEQRDAIQRFFSSTAEAVRKLAGTT